MISNKYDTESIHIQDNENCLIVQFSIPKSIPNLQEKHHNIKSMFHSINLFLNTLVKDQEIKDPFIIQGSQKILDDFKINSHEITLIINIYKKIEAFLSSK